MGYRLADNTAIPSGAAACADTPVPDRRRYNPGGAVYFADP